MTQEDKKLLLADLCGRLPYGVCVNIEGFDYDFNGKLVQVYFGNINRCSIQVGSNISYSLEETKPWLRPMSSMTEEESAELSNIINEWFDKELFYLTEEPFLEYALSKINYSISPQLFDWLNAHHFDYRGLIEKGLAMEAPKGMYGKENKL